MMPRLVTVLAIGLTAGMAIASAQAQIGSFAGRWHWNGATSTAVPGEAPPKDVALEISDAEIGKLSWTVTITDDKNEQHVESFDGPLDGKPVPLKGSNDGTTVALTVSGETLKASYRNPQGGSDQQSCTIASIGKMLTCNGAEGDGKGHTTNYVDVYDRQ
jgi:hypothetical protein